jgi:hypothetical protein
MTREPGGRFHGPGERGSGSDSTGTASFRYPERLGPFNVWISETVYPEREQALEACRHYAQIIERKREQLGLNAGPREMADTEVVDAAREVLGSLDRLWERIRTQPGVAILGESRLARRLVFASTIEWALEIVYQIRTITREDAGGGLRRWKVGGRAWRGEVSWNSEGTSRAFAEEDRALSELALLEACANAYASCMATLGGWDELAVED